MTHTATLFADEHLGFADESNGALVRFARLVVEGREAVVDEDQAFHLRRALPGVGGGLGQIKTRSDPGHDADAFAEEPAHDIFRVGLVGQGDDRIGVGVVNEPLRQEPMQEGLDRGSRVAGRQQGVREVIHHRLVGERGERP